jgi:hypothetical protein
MSKFHLSVKIWLIICLSNAIFSAYVSAEITVDGRLDETEWKQAQRFENFVETSPFSLKETTHPTEVLILTDEKGIYFGFINEQPWDTRYRRKQERDAMWADSDRNFLSIDFDGKANMGYFFGVSLGGSMSDGSISGESQMDRDWDGDWEAKTSESETHWYSEFFLPWTVVPMMSGQESKRNIGVYFSRQMMQEGKVIGFPGLNYERKKFLSLFHPITVDQYEATKFDVFPYAVGSYDNLQDSAEYQAGLDLFWALGNGRELNMTVNPDFGQVESDEVVINFSPVETFFSDRRPFFAENQGLFNISHGNDYHLINTRRIGASPDYNCTDFSVANGGSDALQESCENEQEASNGIDTAVKFTQLGENTDVGFFAAFEDDETFSAGREFYAVRALRRLNQHKLGYLATHVERDALDRSATVHAFDYENQATETLTLNSLLMYSDTIDESGYGMRFGMNYDPNKFWNTEIAYYRFDDDLNINDMGYQTRNNLSNFRTFTMYTETDFLTTSKILERTYTLLFSKKADTHGLQLSQNINLSFKQAFKDTSGFEIKFGHGSSGNDDLLTRGSALAPFVKFGQGRQFELTYYGKQNKRWSYWAYLSRDRRSFQSFTGSSNTIALGGNYYPSDDLKFGIHLGKANSKNWLNWLGDNRLGTYPLDYFSIRANATWFPKEKHELRIKFQTNIMETETGAEWLADSTGNLNSANSPAAGFDLGQLAFQVRYKYEISPLSHFYAVYTRGGRHYEDDDVSVSEIISGTWNNPKEDRFTLKLRMKF